MTSGYYPDTKITDLQGDYLAINTDGSINVGVVASSATQAVNITQVGGVATGGSSLPINDASGSITVDGTVTANAGTGNFTSKPYTPAVADILCGGATITNSAAATTLITIPLNRTWYGSLGLNFHSAEGTPGANFRTAVITTAGTGVTPAAATILCKVTSHQQVTPSTTVEGPYPGFAFVPWIYINAPVGNAVTVTCTLSVAATTLTANAWANGVLL